MDITRDKLNNIIYDTTQTSTSEHKHKQQIQAQEKEIKRGEKNGRSKKYK